MRYFIILLSAFIFLGACSPAGQWAPQLYVGDTVLPAEPQGSIHDYMGNMREGQGFPDHIYQEPFGNVSSPSYGLGFTYRF